MEEDIKEINLNRLKWTSRRRMAWVSLLVFFYFTYEMFFHVAENRLEALDPVYTWLAITCLTVVGAYMGSTAWADVAGKVKK